MIYKKIIFLYLFIFLVFISKVNSQLTIGVSPPILDLGEIDPDSTKIARFNLITSSNEVILTYLTPTNGRFDWIGSSSYKNHMSNFSEQDIVSWVEFTKNPAQVERTEGGTIKGASEVTFILDVPEDVESGYHVGNIDLDPIGPQKGGMFNIKATVPLVFVFKVSGKAVRSARIIDIVPGEYSGNSLNLKMFVENTGTVTLKTFVGKVDVFDSDEKIASLSGSTSTIKPGEIGIITLPWSGNNVEEGFYDVSGIFDYSSDLTIKNTTIEVSKIHKIPTSKVVEEAYVFPWWIIGALIIIFTLAYFIYRD
jgi:hypothetical protein